MGDWPKSSAYCPLSDVLSLTGHEFGLGRVKPLGGLPSKLREAAIATRLPAKLL